MAFRDWWPFAPRAAVQQDGGGTPLVTAEQIAEALRVGSETASGAFVTPDRAMKVGTVYACVRILSEAIGQLPLRLYRRDGEGRLPATDHPLHHVLAHRPNRWQTAYEFRQMAVSHICLRGNFFALIIRSRGRVLELIPLDPRRVGVEQAADQSLTYTYQRHDGRSVQFKGGRNGEIFHVRGLTTDGVMGLSPIGAAREAIGLAMQTEAHGARLFKQGANMGGVLKVERALTEEAVTRLKKQLDEKHSGTANVGKWLVLEEGMDAANIGMTNEDAQFLETRKFQRSDIAMFFGIPPHMLGDVEKATSWGSGIEQQGIGFLQYTVNPWLVRFEQAGARDLLTDDEELDLYLRHNVEALLRGDFKSRQEGLQIQRRNGVINANEWRAIEEKNPRTDDDGDAYIVEMNMTPSPQPSEDKP